MSIKEETLVPHILIIPWIFLGWGNFFFPYKHNKRSTKNKTKSNWPHGNGNTLTINFFFLREKAFNFQAFKVIQNSISTSNKTNVFKPASIMVSDGKKIRDMRKMRKWKKVEKKSQLYSVRAFPPRLCSPALPSENASGVGSLPSQLSPVPSAATHHHTCVNKTKSFQEFSCGTVG